MRFILLFCVLSIDAYAYKPFFTGSRYLKESGQLIVTADVDYKLGEELDEAKDDIGRDSCNHFMFLPLEYSHLVDSIGIGRVEKKYSSMEARLIGLDGKFYDLVGIEKKSILWQRLTFRHKPAVGRFVLFGDTKGVNWNPPVVDKTFKASCVKLADNIKRERPTKEVIKEEKLDPKKLGSITKSSTTYYKVDGIKERVYYAEFELYGLGQIYQVGLVEGNDCTILNEFQDYYSELKGNIIGGDNAQEFVGLMKLGDKEKWLVFEAVGYEWWGYTTIPYNGGKPVEREMIETVFYGGL